jgi:uncharacterized protein YegL
MKQWLIGKAQGKAIPDETALADNPEPRSQCIVVADKSISMRGAKIIQLNRGLIDLCQELHADEMAAERIEVALIEFGPVKVTQEFVLAKDLSPPQLSTGGTTPLCEAVCKAGQLIQERRQLYRKFELDSYRPFVVVVTDGAPDPDESLDEAKNLVREFETAANEADRAAFFFFGVEGANMETLKKISYRKPLPLDPRHFRGMFRWVAASMQTISRSIVGDNVELPAITDWLKLDPNS